jgi:hypothetical protein
MPGQEYQRDKEQVRLDFRGMTTVVPPDLMPPGKFPFAQNVRAYIRGGVIGRTTQAPLYQGYSGEITDLRYLNDSFNTAGGGAPYLYVRTFSPSGSERGALYVNSTAVAGANIAPFGSMVPFRPNNSPQPWMYVYDQYHMYKVRSDRTIYKQGIAEPQVAPTVTPAVGGALSLTAQWWYVYRSSITGAVSNPSPASAIVTLTNQLAMVSIPQPPPDHQVDTIDVYRQDVQGTGSLSNPTYVGSVYVGLGGSVNAVDFFDSYQDVVVAANPTMSFANMEPFPTIGLPINGGGNWTGGPSGVYTQTAGPALPANLLPGTSVLMGDVAGTVIARPIGNTVQLELATSVPASTGYTFQIQNPVLAGTALPWAWGPTDNVQYIFACGDPNNPGRLYWTTGNNPDASSDTNTQDITSGSEVLMNGCIVSGLGMVFSNQRAWLIYPNFFQAQATVTGVLGNPWSLVLSISNRGLIAHRALTTDGGGNVYFGSTDGIYVSPGGNGSQSISGDIDNLFPKEGNKTTVPQPITLNGQTIYPPAYGALDNMVLRMGGPYLYFDHLTSTGAPQTLVYDTTSGGWTLDVYADPVTIHGWEDISPAGFVADERPVVGTSNGNVYTLSITGTEAATAVVLTPAFDAGDARADKQWGDIFIRAATDVGTNITLAAYGNVYENPIGIDPTTISSSGNEQPFIVDFEPQQEIYQRDMGMELSWPIGHNTFVTVWQPSFVAIPETTDGRVSQWDNGGSPLNKWLQGFVIDGDTGGLTKSLSVQGEGGQTATPTEPILLNGRGGAAYSLPIPMVTHLMRLVPGDDEVPYRLYNLQWVFEPYPELCMNWVSVPTSHGFPGWQHLREMNIGHRSTNDLTLVITPDYGTPSSYMIPSSGDLVTKTKVTIVAPTKYKVVQYGIFSAVRGFYLFLENIECKVKPWGSTGPYQNVRPFGGPSKMGAIV